MNCRIRSSVAWRSRTSHSQSSRTAQPRSDNACILRASRARFASIFGDQHPRFDFDPGASLHPCPCQKQPCTKMAFRRLGRTTSGQPGRSLRCNRKRYPRLCSSYLTASSGFVSWLRIRLIRRDLASGARVSMRTPVRERYLDREVPDGSSAAITPMRSCRPSIRSKQCAQNCPASVPQGNGSDPPGCRASHLQLCPRSGTCA